VAFFTAAGSTTAFFLEAFSGAGIFCETWKMAKITFANFEINGFGGH
jgi:hypothetical protein